MYIYSLKNQKEFNSVQKSGVKKRSLYFTVVCSSNSLSLPNMLKNSTSLGLKISKKFSKKATVRNKLRRQIKHILYYFINNSSKVNLRNKALIIIPRFRVENSIRFVALQQDLIRTLLYMTS